MAKVALLIGVSEYGSGLTPLPGAIEAVDAMQHVLQSSEMGGFDEVVQLVNPNPPQMREAIETLFSDRTKNDIVLLFFSGHIIQDERNNVLFTTSITCLSPKAELVKVSAIPASFVQDMMSNSGTQRPVVILDCCFNSMLTQEMVDNYHSLVKIKRQLSGKGRAILTSFTSPQNFLESEKFGHSVYTRYLAEGISTGAADLDNDGWISVDELHEYASQKVKSSAPSVKLEFNFLEDGYKIFLAKVPLDEPKLKYRKAVESWVRSGKIAESGRYILDKLAEDLQLTSEDCIVLEAEVVKPYQEYQEKLQRYEQELKTVMSIDTAATSLEREALRQLQQSLGLTNEDVAPIKERIALMLASSPQVKDDADEVIESNIDGYLKSVPSVSGAVLEQPIPTPPVQPPNPTSIVNPAFSSESLPINPPASSTPRKFLLLGGIGGGLVALAVGVGMLYRPSGEPTPETTNQISASPVSSLSPSTPTPNSDNTPSPSPIAPPESKDCFVLVNGNLRSEPTGFRDNVVESLREPLPVTGKQTQGGWVEVKLSNKKVAWAHRQIITNDAAMDACLAKKKIKIRTVEDILPPPPKQTNSTSF